MPVFNFKCEQCEREWKDLVKAGENSNCPNCKKEVPSLMPKAASTVVMETPSKLQGKKIVKGIDKMLKDRSDQHLRKYELADRIDEHGLDDAKRLGWLKKIKRT